MKKRLPLLRNKKIPLMKFLSGILLVGLLATDILSGQNPNIEFVEFDLDNGLHVILHQDHSTPIVAISIMYHVGSKNEDPERTGFAHFFEHLLFEGSENIGRGEFSELITAAGGTLNAYTTFDKTYYHEVLPSNQLELGLYLESERMLHAKIDSIGIETQRQVVKEERRTSYDNQPYGTFLEETMKRCYTVHPYRWTTIGSMDHLNAARDEEFVEFYKLYYVPDNAVLSIAGDLDIEETKFLVEKYFNEIPRSTTEIPRPTEVEPEQTTERRDVVYDNIQLPAVIQSYHIPAQGTDDYYAVSMVAQLLSQGESSRLSKSIKDEQQKALAVGAFPLNLEDPGVTIAYGIANVGVSPEDLEAAMETEYEKVKSELISEEEFQKLRNQIENDFISGNARVAGIAESLANYHMYFGDTNLINSEIERYMKVTREDIQRAANKYFTKENRVVLYYLPKSAQQQPETTEINKEG
jgi:predicted Zn-dependent peptidase